MSSRSASSALQSSAPRTGQDSLGLRLLLAAAVIVTALTLLSLILLLAFYFTGTPVWPVLSWFGLYGMPLAMGLALVYLVAAAIRRRRA